jgi:hypothetical protein
VGDLGDPRAVERQTLLNDDQQLLQGGVGELNLTFFALQSDFVAARDEAHLGEDLFNLPEVPVRVSQ